MWVQTHFLLLFVNKKYPETYILLWKGGWFWLFTHFANKKPSASPRAFYCCKMCKKSKSPPFLYYEIIKTYKKGACDELYWTQQRNHPEKFRTADIAKSAWKAAKSAWWSTWKTEKCGTADTWYILYSKRVHMNIIKKAWHWKVKRPGLEVLLVYHNLHSFVAISAVLMHSAVFCNYVLL